MSVAEWTDTYGIHHYRIVWSNYRKLVWVGFKTTTTDHLFIPPEGAEAITWENFVPAKRDPSYTKEGSCFTVLPDPILHVIAVCNLWRVYNTPGKAEQNFIPANQDYVITTQEYLLQTL